MGPKALDAKTNIYILEVVAGKIKREHEALQRNACFAK